MAVSRQREYLADATSVQFTRNPNGLISALGKLAENGRALSRSESCHAASLHRQSRPDLHGQDARRSWPRIPTSRIASLACAIWAASLGVAAAFDLQGHRGARGLAPENTLAGFKHGARSRRHHARDRPCDHQGRRSSCISHDPLLNPDLTRGPDGQVARHGRARRSARSPWPTSSATTSAGSIRRASTASNIPSRSRSTASAFRPSPSSSPWPGPDVRFNIEIKTDPTKPDLTVDPARFARPGRRRRSARARPAARSTIQSFDWRGLLEVRGWRPRSPPAASPSRATTSTRSSAPAAGRRPGWAASTSRRMAGRCRGWPRPPAAPPGRPSGAMSRRRHREGSPGARPQGGALDRE